MNTSVEGRLEVTSPILRGPSGAPDGFEFALGAFASSQPAAIRNGTITQGSQITTFTTTDASMRGVTMSLGFARRYVTALFQESIGLGTQSRISGDGSGTSSFTEHILYGDTSLRMGARLPLHYFALSAGSGIALSLWSPETPSDSPQLTVDFPVWASLDVKPLCDWGLRFTGSVNLDPFVQDETSVMAGAMLLYQPSASCSESAGVTIGS